MNKVVHFEIPADDLERAKKFYAEVFDWQVSEWPMPQGGVYTGVRTVAVNEETQTPEEAGAINGALVDRSPENPTPLVTMEVESINDHFVKIEAAGGSRVVERTEIPGMGAYAYAKDSEGNIIGLWENAPKA